jgi:hypothetical protein
MPGDIARKDLIMSDLIAKVVAIVRGRWEYIKNGAQCTVARYHFPSGTIRDYNSADYPGYIRQRLADYGQSQKLADGVGGKDKSEADKIAGMDHIHAYLCRGFWKDPDVEGKGGVKKADLTAAEAKAALHEERANRLGAALEDERKANLAEKARMMKIIADLTAKANAKGRK